MENEKWKQITICTDSNFFKVFQQVSKQLNPTQNSAIISVLNQDRSAKLKKEIKDLFRLDLEWQEDGNICGYNIFKKVE